MNFFVMKAAMRKRPYVVNEAPLPIGYWQNFYSSALSGQSWVPPKFRLERKSSALGDVLGWIGGVPLYSSAAVEMLTELDGGAIKFVFLGEVRERPYWIISRVTNIGNLAPASISQAAAVFCLPGNELREILVKPCVPERVVALRLTGFEFRRPNHPNLKALFRGDNTNDYPGILP